MLQQAFVQAKAYISALQRVAVELRQKQVAANGRQRLVQVLKALQQVHRLVTNLLSLVEVKDTSIPYLLEQGPAQGCCNIHGEHLTLSGGLNKQLQDCRAALPKQVLEYLPEEGLSVDAFLAQRQKDLDAETATNQQAAQLLGLDQQATNNLSHIVTQLRSVESSVRFQALLQHQVAAVAGEAGYSTGNFAYNSTPFASWAKVHSHPEVLAAVQSAMSCPSCRAVNSDYACSNNSSKVYMVWGSSTGWLAFYAALTYTSWQVVGVELLPALVQIAQQVAQEAGITRASFTCADLLETDLRDVGVLMLTEQCWDEELIQKACYKLQRELSEGAVVIDYTGAMGKAGLASCSAFSVEVAVGWNQHQLMHVYVKAGRRTELECGSNG